MRFPNGKRFFCFSSERGVALVVVLSLVVIVSLILVAFVTVMQMDRVASASYSQSVATEQIGQGALQRVIAELRNEMRADALPNTVAGKDIYTNVTAANLVPQRIGTNSSMTNLVKISSINAYTNASGTSVGTLLASGISSAAPSFNKRYLDAGRWSAAFLGTFPADATLPSWVLVTRSGLTNSGVFGRTGETLNNASSDNPKYAIGRFAYAIYNVGGLLDATVAGFPSSLSARQVNQLKGTLASADLSAVGITDANAFMSWRNATTAASTSSYLSYVTNAASTNGFLKVFPGDTTFLSRQDLIKAAVAGSIVGLTTNALPNLTVFTREKNAPSWGPSLNAGTVAGFNFDYQNNANLSDSTNRFIPLVRSPATATITGYRGDGPAYPYEIKAGEPLIQRRFFLGRLNWLGPNGPQNGGTTGNIQACFGLRWDESAHVWRYVGHTGVVQQSSIKTLSDIAAEPVLREPNFFELLQAGILAGSLGVSGTPAITNGSGLVADAPTLHQESRMLQVMRIGAAIIDQYDEDSFPTVIEYMDATKAPATTWQAVGTEDLPYLNTFRVVVGTSPDTPAAAPTALAVYLTVGLWNPHQINPSTVTRPNLRVRMSGLIGIANGYGAGTVAVSPGLKGYITEIPAVGGAISLNAAGVSGFREPELLTAATAGAVGAANANGNAWAETPPLNPYPGDKLSAVAFRLRDLELDITKPAVAAADFFGYNSVYVRFMPDTDLSKRFQISLEYQTPSGGWIPYSRLNGVNDPRTWLASNAPFYVWFGRRGGTPSQCLDAARFNANFDNYGTVRLSPAIPGDSTNLAAFPETPANSYWVNPIRMAIDPRSLRFTWFYSGGSGALPQISRGGYKPFWAASMPDAGYQNSGYAFDRSKTGNGAEFVPPIFSSVNPSFYPAQLTRNNTDNSGVFSSYLDRDGVRRIGDSGMFPSSTNWLSGNPHGRDIDRPVVLNRPFQSVAELGFVFRDDPWKSLDFFSGESADGALLDLFTVSDIEVGKVAGKIDLNTQNLAALEAVIRGVSPDVNSPNVALTNPADVAAGLAGLTMTNVVVNKSDLVTRFVGNTNAFPAVTDENRIKQRREAISRTLADVGQTRTWNLMIDLVAQSGRFPQTATTMDQFVVEGERRYWVHIAIDRFTGEIVDQQFEQVTE